MNRIYLDGNDWMFKEFVGLDWVWRNSEKPNTKDVRWWYKATVPGSVLHDLWQAGKVPDPHYELNSKLVEWVPERTWVYKKSFSVPEKLSGKKITLCFEGIDYSASIFLNGKPLGKQEGEFIPWEVDVTDMLLYHEDNLLSVVIDPAPFEQPQVGKTSLVRTHKTRMNYWWDFCPRMIHQGIWDSVYLKITGQAVLQEVYLSAKLNTDYTNAALTAEVEAEAEDGCEIVMKVQEQTVTGKIHRRKAKLILAMDHPKLWQPNGYGEPYQYHVTFVLKDRAGEPSDKKELKYGIREITFEKNERCNPNATPFVLKVNGRKIYINGYNWVPIDAMYGVERPEKLNRLIKLAKNAHTIMFRVWGGGLIEKDAFYEACAENGILIWQEFIQSSSGIDNKPPEDPSFIHRLAAQAEIIVKRKRNHTALAIWCGGNELSDWEGNPVDNSDLLIRKLKEVVERLDPQRRWLPSSPSGGVFNNSVKNIMEQPDMLWDVHGPWEHQGLQKHCELYNMGTSLLHSEFGVEGMTNKNTLEKTIAKEHLLPASKENEIYFHRGAWWTNEPLVQEMFGGLDAIDQIRTASQYMQYEGLKYAIESNRRRAFQNSGSFPWQFNEPYPNAYCTSSLDYYANPKPVYYGVLSCYSPVHVSASFASPSVAEKQRFTSEVFLTTSLLTDEINKIGDLSLQCEIAGMDGKIIFFERQTCALPENSTKSVITINQDLKDIKSELFLLRLKLYNSNDDTNECVAENEYLFTKGKDLGSVFHMDAPVLNIWQQSNGVKIYNQGNNAALFLFLTDNGSLPQKDFLYFDNNYFCLLPGEERNIQITSDSGSITGKTISIENFVSNNYITLR